MPGRSTQYEAAEVIRASREPFAVQPIVVVVSESLAQRRYSSTAVVERYGATVVSSSGIWWLVSQTISCYGGWYADVVKYRGKAPAKRMLQGCYKDGTAV